jgi:putative transposase
VLELRQNFVLSDLLRFAGLARSTFYYQQGVVQALDKHCELKKKISQIFERHKGRYGYRRITATLQHQGLVINHKTVRKLMTNMKLKSLVRPKRYRAFQGNIGAAAPNLLQRDFTAQRPREKLATDSTEFNVEGQKLHLSPVMDLYNREIVAYEITQHSNSKMVEGMLTKTLSKLKLKRNERPLLHSDQGWHYRTPTYVQTLRRNGVVQSMSRKANCLDNAAMESFFATLKCEMFYPNKFKTVVELKEALHKYIRYYNVDRIKMGLKGLSPIAFRLQGAAATAA